MGTPEKVSGAVEIVVIPSDVLRKSAAPVDLQDLAAVQAIVNTLETTLSATTNPKGVGLAGPQVGLSVRAYATCFEPSLNSPNATDSDEPKDKPVMVTMINPELVEASKDKTYGSNPEDPFLEGCLSIPEIYGPVPRHVWVRYRYHVLKNGKLEQQEQTFYGFPGRVVQHENDHIDGILFTDYAKEFRLPLFRGTGRGKKMKLLTEPERNKLFDQAA